MCQNHFLNFCTLPLICYNILKIASIEVKLITSSSQTRIQVVVSGTDFPANFCLRVCVCPAFLVCGTYLSGNRPCMRVCQTFRYRNNQLNTVGGFSQLDAVGLRPAWISVSGSELGCLRWSTLRNSPAVVVLRPGNRSSESSLELSIMSTKCNSYFESLLLTFFLQLKNI